MSPDQPLARHLLAEYYGCDVAALNDKEGLTQALVEAAAAAKTTLIKVDVHKFEPYGLSGVAILAESHLAIHTWPEHQFASVELYVCGEDADPAAGDAILRKRLGASHAAVKLIDRGNMATIKKHLKHHDS